MRMSAQLRTPMTAIAVACQGARPSAPTLMVAIHVTAPLAIPWMSIESHALVSAGNSFTAASSLNSPQSCGRHQSKFVVLPPDVNECTEPSHLCTCDATFPQCNAICTNTVGSYTCSCSVGYQIDQGGLDCIGKYSARQSDSRSLLLLVSQPPPEQGPPEQPPSEQSPPQNRPP